MTGADTAHGYDPGDPAEETGDLSDAEIETLDRWSDPFSRAAEWDRRRNLALRDSLGLRPGGGALR